MKRRRRTRQIVTLLSVGAAFSILPLRANCTEVTETIAKIVEAGKARESSMCHSAIAEWTISERVLPTSLAFSAKGAGVEVPAQEVMLRRQATLVLRGTEWRFDQDGEQFFTPPGGTRLEPHVMQQIYVSKDGRVQFFWRIDGSRGPTQGQLFHKDDRDCPIQNDVAHVISFLYARPSKTAIFQSISHGDYDVADDAPRTHDTWVCLRDKKWRTTRICFDAQKSYIPVLLECPPRTEIEVSYADFPDFGLGPKKWTGSRISEEGAVERVWSAEVTRWQRQPPNLNELLDYKFPHGTEVFDLDNDRRFFAGENGHPPESLGAASRGPSGRRRFLSALILAVGVIAVLCFSRLRRVRTGS